jgi:uncharacterized phage protein (TIGR02218 family)
MKSAVAPPETSVLCLRISCVNGTTFRLTQYPVDLVMSNSSVYSAVIGHDFTSFEATASFSPSSFDLSGILSALGITFSTVMDGTLDGARCYLFRTNFLAPVEDYEPITSSILGKTRLEDGKFTIEEMSLIDALNQPAGGSVLPSCPKVFGGQEYAGCMKVVSPSSGTITHAPSQFSVRDSARSEAVDWFGLGKIWFTTGANVGIKPREIKDYTASGWITVYEPFYYPVAVGDAYLMLPGCRKRREDCSTKWANIENFGGFPDVPTTSSYSQVGNRQ